MIVSNSFGHVKVVLIHVFLLLSAPSSSAVVPFTDGEEMIIGEPFSRCATLPPDPVEAVKSVKIVREFRARYYGIVENDTLNHGRRHLIDDEQYHHIERKAAGATSMRPFAAVVPIYYHIIQGNNSIAGAVSDDLIKQQQDVINAAYAVAGFTFEHVGTTRTKNQRWFESISLGNQRDMEMKRALHQGGKYTLNVYITNASALGYSTFPAEREVALDGVVIHYKSLPGYPVAPTSFAAPYNEGDTAVHEIGHWLNLHHTYEGFDCSKAGDFVNDTAPECNITMTCDSDPPVDTCPSQPGVDNVHNYMSYATDSCIDHFTPGQILRMQASWAYYRAGPTFSTTCLKRCRKQQLESSCLQKECPNGIPVRRNSTSICKQARLLKSGGDYVAGSTRISSLTVTQSTKKAGVSGNSNLSIPQCVFPVTSPGMAWYKLQGTGRKYSVTATTTTTTTNTAINSSSNTTTDNSSNNTTSSSILFATQISVFQGQDCSSLQCVGDSSGSNSSTITTSVSLQNAKVHFQTQQGVFYYILVHGWGVQTGDFELKLTVETNG